MPEKQGFFDDNSVRLALIMGITVLGISALICLTYLSTLWTKCG